MAFSGAQITRLGLSGFHRSLYGDFSGKTQSDNPVVEVDEEQPSGGWWFRYEQEMFRREDERRELERLKAQAEEIEDDLEREIAKEIREDDTEQVRLAELNRLRDMAIRYRADLQEVASPQVVRAAERAIERGNYSAMEAFERELARMREEEQFLEMAVRMVINA